MRALLCIAVTVAVVTASPSGYYHQEYNYKTSSSAFKNNELQHKTDDQGYYSKDGDLEGRVKPKVSSNSEHSEYVNPNLRQQANGGYYDAGSDMRSHGNMLANGYGGSVGGQVSSGYQSGSQYENNLRSEGLASSDYIGGAGYSSGSYSAGSGASYESTNLRGLISRLQNDLQHELQSAVVDQSQRVDISELEAELRRNLTARLNEVLQEKYGTQTIRGGQSFSLSEGRLQTRPNYDQNELQQLQRQMESSLLQKLQQDYNYRTSHSSQQTINQHNYERYESTTTYRPVYPNLNVINPQDKYPTYGVSKDSHHSQYNVDRVTSNMEYTRVPNAVSITNIVSNVQSNLNNQLNRVLEDAQRQYFSENSQQTSLSTTPVLEKIKEDLRHNLNYAIEEELRKNFGTQFQRNGYMFSTGSSNQYNYNVADLDNLRRQVEENLITKATRDFEAAKQHWISRQQHSQSQQSQQIQYGHSQSNDYNYGASNNQRYEYSTPRYTDNDYYRPTAASIIPLIQSGVKGNRYQSGVSGSHHSGYEATSGSSSVAHLQSELLADLSSQLQAALNQNKAYVGRYSTTGDGQASFDEAYRRLNDELQRNLTQQLQSVQAGGSSYSSSYGDVSGSQLAQLRSQLQNNLSSQLRQGLQQSYSASASYSASSGSSASAGSGAYSSSNTGGYYRPTRGSDNYQYGQQMFGVHNLLEGEDCQGDDPLAHQNHRAKRSYGYRSRPLGLSSHAGAGYDSRGTYGGYSSYGSHSPVGQEEDDSEIIQGHGYSVASNRGTQNAGQEIDDDDTQQIEVDHGFNIEQASSHGSQVAVGQQEDDSDDTQQVQIDHGFGTIGLGSQNVYAGYETTPNSKQSHSEIVKPFNENGKDSTQSTQTNQKPLYQDGQVTNFGVQGGLGYQRNKPNSQSMQRGDIGQTSSSKFSVGQEEDNSDDTQQIEHNRFSGIEIRNQNNRPRGYEREFLPKKNLTGIREFDTDTHREIQSSSHQRTYGYQQNYQSTYGLGGLDRPTQNYGNNQFLGQEVDNSDDTQQIEINNDFTTPKLNNQYSQNYPFNIDKPLNQYTGLSSTGKPDVATSEGSIIPQISTPKTLTQSSPKYDFGGSLYAQNNFGQQVDDTDTTRLHQSNNFGYTSNLKPQSQLGQQVDDFDTFQYSKPSSDNTNQFETFSKPSIDRSDFITPSTPKNPLLLQFGSQNVIPETETVQPLSNNFFNTVPTTTTILPVQTFSQKPSNVGSFLNNEPTRPQTYDVFSPTGSVNTQNENLLPGNQLAQSGISSLLPAEANIPFKLREVSTQIQADLNDQIEDVVKNDLPLSVAPNQLYKDTLYNLRANISRDCQKLLQDSKYSYLNVQQKDLTILEKYIESHLVQKLDEKFRTSGYFRGDSTGYQSASQKPTNLFNNYDNRPGYGQYSGYRPRPHTSATTFLQREINSQDNQFQISHTPYGEIPISSSANPLESDSYINYNLLSQTSPRQVSVDISSTPLPTLETVVSPPSTVVQIPSQSHVDNARQIFNKAEDEADLLIKSLRDSLQNVHRQTTSNINQDSVSYNNKQYDHSTEEHQYQPRYKVVQVKLENITPEQLNLIVQIEKDFANDIDLAVQNADTSSSFTSISKYQLYQTSLNKLEQEIKRNLSDCIEGRNNQNFGNPNLEKYSSLIYQKFDRQKIPDVHKYLEIKLIKKIRAQLKKVYNIETRDETYESPRGSRPQENTVEIVRLENVTPAQLKIIKKIENDINEQIKTAVKIRISSLRKSYSSEYNYKQSLDALQLELKNDITESIQRLCEPGFSQHSQLISNNFDHNKINDLQKYLEIRLVKKLKENIDYFSKFDSIDFTPDSQYRYHSTSSVNYGHGYNNNYHFNNQNELQSEHFNQQPDSSSHPSAASSHQGSVKGGKYRNNQYLETPSNPDIEIISNVPTEQSNVEATEPTTPAENWWKRFGNKVKQGATNIKDKLTGKT